MKFTLKRDGNGADYWNGAKPLPAEINVISHSQHMAECELLSILSVLHGHLTPFDILTSAEPDTEKDKDIASVLTAFQHYLAPKMPLSHYSGSDKRIIPSSITKKVIPIDPSKPLM